jgi:multicomponent Na+:H+ antiporter subunit D
VDPEIRARESASGGWQIQEAPLFCVVPLCFTALGCIVLFFYADQLYAFLQPLGGG